MADAVKRTFLVASGGVAAAIASALCCAGPLIAVAMGVSGAGLAATFEPLRPFFLGATVVLLATGFWLLRVEERRACEPGTLCASPAARRQIRMLLWLATWLAAVFASFPTWSSWILD